MKQRVSPYICHIDNETGKYSVGDTPEIIGALSCDCSNACTCDAIKTGKFQKKRKSDKLCPLHRF
jgi:hypothetical protein